jgi:hypothetical protein
MNERDQFDADIERDIDEQMMDDDEAVCPDCDEIWDMCECRAGDECGRWDNGRLTKRCSKAGSEECDFECPYRGSLYK